MSVIEAKVESKWYTLINNGSKTIEGRVNKPPFDTCRVGDIIRFTAPSSAPVASSSITTLPSITTTSSTHIDSSTNSSDNNEVLRRVVDIKRYRDFGDLLSHESLACVLPGVSDIHDGMAIYSKYYTLDIQHHYGVLALHLQSVNTHDTNASPAIAAVASVVSTPPSAAESTPSTTSAPIANESKQSQSKTAP